MNEPRKIKGCLHQFGFEVWDCPGFTVQEPEELTFIEQSAYDEVKCKLDEANEFINQLHHKFEEMRLKMDILEELIEVKK